MLNSNISQIHADDKEIAIANKQVVTENKNSFDQLIAVSKLYSKLSINAAKSTIPEVKAVYEQEANSALVEQQILLKNITLTKEQQLDVINRTIHESI